MMNQEQHRLDAIESLRVRMEADVVGMKLVINNASARLSLGEEFARAEVWVFEQMIEFLKTLAKAD